MIVTKEWLKEFIDISNISTQDICNAFNSIGLEVDSITTQDIPKGVKIGFVIDCIKHPNADKLSVCQVDLGYEIVQIVCGASNVAKGQYVPVATVGTRLNKDFIIKEAKLRGEASNGMICSATEIGLFAINDGILELDNSIGELILGKELSTYNLINDDIIEIELTANRGDCLNIFGIAKELSAYFNIPLNDIENNINEDERAVGRILEINHSSQIDANLLFKVADITNFKLPLLYKLRMAIVGSVKNTDIETLVSYGTHSTGVLLNIYTQAIAKEFDKIKLNISNTSNNFTQISSNEPLSIVGIEAGYISKPDNTIVLEASYTDPTTLASKVFSTKQKTGDIYYKSSRGSNPDLEFGMKYLVHLLSILKASIYKGQIDFLTDIKQKSINLDIDKINKIIGQKIDKLKIENILTSLGFTQTKINNNILTGNIPATRHDIVNIADVTEEIVRMIGIDNIKAKPLAIREINKINNISNNLTIKNKIRSLAISNSFYETITYVFSSSKLLKKYNFDIVDEKKDILNPISSDLDTFRTTLLLNLILAVSTNEKQDFKSIALFEIGTVFDKNRDETNKIGFVFSGNKENESLQNRAKPSNIDLFEFAQKITNCIGEFELEIKQDIKSKFLHPYQCANIIQNGEIIGFLSKLNPTVSKDFDISSDTFVAQVDFDKLTDDLIQAKKISKYQVVKRDLSIVVPNTIKYKTIKNLLNTIDIKELQQFNLMDIYNDETLQDSSSLTIKFVLQSDEKTLQDEDIVLIMEKIQTLLKEKLDINLR
jgi:phenylalanyl-tRNA synthetase beta chain